MDTQRKDRDNNNPQNDASKPDEGTLHRTDPQKNMEGPVSSMMHDTGEKFDTDESKAEAEKKKDENM